MVDFDVLLETSSKEKLLSPVDIFSGLRKKTGRTHLRGSQEFVLLEWYEKYREIKDNIIKLPTGEGKTLIGLLILQSLLNSKKEPVVYLCPDKYLVSQTVEQAFEFGIKVCQVSEEQKNLPRGFLNADAILITTCHKLFNGKSVFGVKDSNRDIINIGAVVLDDAHRCLDIIREQFSIIIQSTKNNSRNQIYDDFFALFSDSLKNQGAGTYDDICVGREDCVLGVPYWSWYSNTDAVRHILRNYNESEEILFKWDLVKNHLEYCSCVFSGKRIEIVPRITPIDTIPSFTNAKSRIFLSATLTEDAFLIKDLGIDSERVKKPLTHPGLRISGERSIIIPSYANPLLKKEVLIQWIYHLSKKYPSIGKWVIVPSKNVSHDWTEGIVQDRSSLQIFRETLPKDLEKGIANKPLILVNRYDGIDLPNDLCRILVLDSLPRNHLITDYYYNKIRSDSNVTFRSIAQKIEQGMGRGIRSNEDYCIVIILQTDISDFLITKGKRQFLSIESQKQIEIFEKISKQFKPNSDILLEFEGFIDQVIKREEKWIEYYLKEMGSVDGNQSPHDFVDVFKKEREAEIFFTLGQFDKAISIIDELLSNTPENSKDFGWYLQLKASYLFKINQKASLDLQIKSYELNQYLFRPIEGVKYQKLSNRISTQSVTIMELIISQDCSSSLLISIKNKLEKLVFETDHDRFEEGIDDLGKILGFDTQRPEQTYKGGPDNLWKISNNKFWIISCKNEVKRDRGISISEANQLLGHTQWFEERYPEATALPMFCHPSTYLLEGASISSPTYVFFPDYLDRLKEQVYSLYVELTNKPKDSLSTEFITEMLTQYHLTPDLFLNHYVKRVSQSH